MSHIWHNSEYNIRKKSNLLSTKIYDSNKMNKIQLGNCVLRKYIPKNRACLRKFVISKSAEPNIQSSTHYADDF